uniref:G_PROTEIN_RECEP_F1_2 domain-containing protein n=1 Tax=Syphacia muris TaxID=451379 RepID=A0A0N5AWU0_9BILA
MLLAACMAATVFNVIVIYCAVRLFKKSGDTMHIFIISMTLGDLLLTVFCHPQEFLTRRHEVLRHIHLCAVIHFCNWLGLGVSGLSLTMINIDKLIYFQWPLSYDRTMSKTRAIMFCMLIWTVSLSFHTNFSNFSYFRFVSYGWIQQIISNYFYQTFMVLFCVLPVTSSMLVSGYLFRLTRQKRHAPVTVGDSLDTPTFKNKMKSLVFIFATTAWTSFSLLPYRIFNLVRLQLMKEWETYDCDQKMMLNWFAWPLVYLLTINPIINPLITAIIYAPYRITIKKLLLKVPLGNRPLYSYKGESTEQSRY